MDYLIEYWYTATETLRLLLPLLACLSLVTTVAIWYAWMLDRHRYCGHYYDTRPYRRYPRRRRIPRQRCPHCRRPIH